MDDHRVRDVLALIRSGRYDLLSLDIFDTVVWRMVPVPKDVFFLVAHRLREKGWLHDSSSTASFVKERVSAEVRARLGVASHEVTLAQLYAEFPRGYFRDATPEQVMAVEFELECELVRVNPDMREVIRIAKAEGLQTALVSDTYFDTEQIRRLADIDVDHVVLSGEENLSKYRGLHRVLIERTGVTPSRILHVGNDPIADIEGPGALSIERYWFRTLPDPYVELPALELPGALSHRAPYLWHHDAGLTALRGRSMFFCTDPYECWGAGVLGPVIAGFGDWVASRCAALEAGPVLCLMREGRILKQVLDTQETGLPTRELYVSRYVARKAAIFSASRKELEEFVYRPSRQKRVTILRQLGLETEAVDPEEVLTPEETRDLIRQVSRDQALRETVVRDSARVRAGLLAHLERIAGTPLPRRLILVDLGYRGTIQECLQRILQHEGRDVQTHGLYLVTGGEVGHVQATGAVAEGWLAENGQPIAMAHTFMRSPEIAEQSLMADCGTTLGHSTDGDPILDEFRVPPRQRAQVAAIQRGMLAYARSWRQHREIQGIGDTAHLKKHYQAICIRMVARPLPVELELFGRWQHDENFGSEKSRGLAEVEGLDEWALAHMSAHQLASLTTAQVHWPFGFARQLSPVMGEAVTNIFLRTTVPETFESAHEGQNLVAYWDTGKGFRSGESSVHPFLLNNRGRVWKRFTLHTRQLRVRSLGFSIGRKDEVVQLTGIAVRSTAPRGEEIVSRIPHEALEKLGYRHLWQNLYVVEEDPALIVVPLQDLPSDADRVDVDLFFGVVKAA
jgi:FMN phosphatase YigB (HAD superfamily)